MKRIVAIIFSVLVLTVLISCTDKSAMQERLEYVSQCNRADTVFTEVWLPIVDSLVRFFDRHGNANERMMAHYLQGRVYHDMGEAPIALECYQRATEMADTTKKDCDFRTLASIYSQSASLFQKAGLFEHALSSFISASHYFYIAKDTLCYLLCCEWKFAPLYSMGNMDSAEKTMLNARNEYLKYGYREEAAIAISSLIYMYLKDSLRINDAKRFMDIFETESGLFDDNGELPKSRWQYFGLKGRYYESINHFDSAEYYYRKTLQKASSLSQKVISCKGLKSIYNKRHISDSVSKYSELYCTYNDSTFLNRNTEEMARMAALYNYNRQQMLATQKEKEASDLRHFIIFMVLSLMTILSFLAYLFYRYREKLFTQLNRLKDRKDALEEIVRKKEREIKLALEHRESDIDKNIREKQAAIDSVNKELEELKQQIATLQSKAERFQHDRLEDDFYSIGFIEEFEARFKEYEKDYNPPTTREWLRLEKVFSIHFPTYYQKITSKDEITKEHVRICMLIRMDFKERMMAVALKTDSKRIDRAKRQANRILFNEDNASTLKSHLKQFFQ